MPAAQNPAGHSTDAPRERRPLTTGEWSCRGCPFQGPPAGHDGGARCASASGNVLRMKRPL